MEDTLVGRLVTNAEYQFFLDEMEDQGKHCQPDHWLSYHFPRGEGLCPVAGVRPSDAQAFCEWFTKRERSLLRYRLPKRCEINDKQTIIRESGMEMAYWCCTEHQCGPILSELRKFRASNLPFLSKAIDDDCGGVSASLFARPFTHNTATELAVYLDEANGLASAFLACVPHTEIALASKIVRDVASTCGRAEEIARDTLPIHDVGIDMDVASIRGRARDHDAVCARNLAGELAQDLERVYSLARGSSSSERIGTIPSDLESAILQAIAGHYDEGIPDTAVHDSLEKRRALGQARDCVRDFERRLDQARIHARKFASDIDRDHGGARQRLRKWANDLIGKHNLAGDLDGRRDLAKTIDLAKIIERDLRAGNGMEPRQEIIDRLRVGRSECFSLALGFRALHLARKPSRTRSDMSQHDTLWQWAESYFALYVDLVILQARIEGKLLAYEGIRIVRERIEE
jgi:hypothetical protein